MKKIFLNFLIVAPFIYCYGQDSDYKDLDSVDYKGEITNVLDESLVRNPLSKVGRKRAQKNTISFNKNQVKNLEFQNGINCAWVNYSRDVGYSKKESKNFKPDIAEFTKRIESVKNAGGNLIRWWWHTNGETSPVYGVDGLVVNSPFDFSKEIIKILDIAEENGVKIQICLWSFDMLRKQYNNEHLIPYNKRLLTEDVAWKSYWDNCLSQVVTSVGNHKGLFAWEIFNEAALMTELSSWNGKSEGQEGDNGLFLDKVKMVDIVKFVNKTCAAIKKLQPDVMVTTGALGMITNVNDNSDPSNIYFNYYSDDYLRKIGGEPLGVLDFYNIHYYGWMGVKGSPFHRSKKEVALDKPTIIAEFYPYNLKHPMNNFKDSEKVDDIPRDMLGPMLVENNYDGALTWAWSENTRKEYPTDFELDLKPIIESINEKLNITLGQNISFIAAEGVDKIKYNSDQNLIVIDNTPKGSVFELFNIVGKSLISIEPKFEKFQVDISQFGIGVYVAILKHNSKIYRFKFVKT
ncbi:T9SS type A sorting domain-containing protein [Aquimarina agarilytica]|uniref:T9SS type A sorting domain-containing protein n=1 Tax=Aquimarina agarilytica TaxID=1087449 RepID=UPI000288AB52|nr:T9SS type A sorting domain-containing protein [Aquimarina agarilytica]